MQIVIDVPDRIYKINQNRRLNITDAEILEKAVKNGIPLDKIRAEIEQGYCEVEDDYDRGRNMGLYIAMQIIDKYKAESEE